MIPNFVAKAVRGAVSDLRLTIDRDMLVLSGNPDVVARGKSLVAQFDVPAPASQVTRVYRLRTIDAAAAASLLRKSFPSITVNETTDLNALSVQGVFAEQQQVAATLDQLDSSAANAQNGQPGASGGSFEVVTLRSATPGQGNSGADNSSPILQALQQLVPGVRATFIAQTGQLALVGDPASLNLAKEFIAKLDVPADLVVLDTEVLEIDESTAKNLGLLIGPVLATTFSEISPIADPTTGVSRLGNLGAITRTPLSLTAQLNLQIQNGTARVLADPKIATLSGRTATIRAGDTIGILTSVGGGAGTYTTTQLQTFQTGVTLDITPLVTPDGYITVALHPIVNSLSGLLNGVPQISTRDTQTTVHLRDNETLVIGGLIQESNQVTINKVPLLGDIPVLGGLFKNNQTSSTRNELIITVTPHIVRDGDASKFLQSGLPTVPTAAPAATSATPTPARSESPRPSASPLAAPTLPIPSPTPSDPGVSTAKPRGRAGFSRFGTIPATNAAGPGDPIQIFEATISPAAAHSGSTISIEAITGTNASRVTATYGSKSTNLDANPSGFWHGSFTFVPEPGATNGSTVSVTLTAYRSDGASAQIQLPINIDAPP
jgi:type II secretory pathway component GspD/PulD (secretin)